MKVRILMVGTSLKTRGGIATVVKGYLDSNLQDACQIKYIPMHCDGNYPQKIWAAFSGYIRFIIFLLFFNPQIIHLHVASRASFYRKAPIVFLSSLFKKKIIYHQHGAEFMKFYNKENSPYKQKIIKIVLRRANIIIALSEQWEKNLLDIDIGLPVHVLPNALIIPDQLQNKTNKTVPQILFMGRIGMRKGIHDLILAAENLFRKGFFFRLVLCGDGDITKWKNKCLKKGIDKIIEFKGWISGEDKVRLFQDVDIYVLPSYNEGLPMSVLEAASYGLPVVSTRVGGVPEAVKNEVTGFLLEPGDVNGLTQKLEQLLCDEKLRIKMGMSGRKLVMDNFDLSKNIQDLIQIYSLLVKNK